jgi:hypothetical protein
LKLLDGSTLPNKHPFKDKEIDHVLYSTNKPNNFLDNLRLKENVDFYITLFYKDIELPVIKSRKDKRLFYLTIIEDKSREKTLEYDFIDCN